MSDDIEARVSRLLDKLEDRTLSDQEIDRIQKKIEILRGQGRSE